MSYNSSSSSMSFLSASTLPYKLLQSEDAVVNGRIRPIHLQLIPTNRCNAACRWCSCQNVDRKQEMPWAEIQELLEYFHKLGSRAITITGGGEPTLHPNFDDLLEYANSLGYDLGLVTNGLRWNKKSDILPANKYLTWVRVSVIDTESGEYKTGIVETVANRLPDVDIGISFTVASDVSISTATKICRIAKATPNITHIRFVEDIVDLPQNIMDSVEDACKGITDKALFQRRSDFTPGQAPCLISLLKPVIDVDGSIYPCCGVQYAAGGSEQDLKMPERFKMCHWRDHNEAEPFDGSICKKCYYQSYNQALLGMTQKLEHNNFL